MMPPGTASECRDQCAARANSVSGLRLHRRINDDECILLAGVCGYHDFAGSGFDEPIDDLATLDHRCLLELGFQVRDAAFGFLDGALAQVFVGARHEITWTSQPPRGGPAIRYPA